MSLMVFLSLEIFKYMDFSNHKSLLNGLKRSPLNFDLNVCRMGDYVVMGGRSAVKDHVSIASKVSLTY